jgi:transcriptional regulator GlxA family with amidase domain
VHARASINAYSGKHDGRIFEVCFGMTARRPDPRITLIVDRLQRRLAEPVSVAALARVVNLSESRFRALFAAQTGMAPGQYLQRLRLRRARMLLERTFLSVKEVMALVGYNDPSHFSRDFRREHGAAPSDMRAPGEKRARSPSVDSPTFRRIGQPRARDPGRRAA